MASVIDDPGGKRRISFVGPEGRKTIYVGKMNRKAAESICSRVEAILSALFQGVPIDAETAAWLGSRPDKLYAKLANVGLVSPRGVKPEAPAVTLGAWLDQYINGRTDAKPSTLTNLKAAQRSLVGFFGVEKRLDGITPGDTDDFRRSLLSQMAENTARRHCGRAKQFFNAAMRKRLIAENPFADMKGCGVRANPERLHFISREAAAAVLEACPDNEWRLLFALARYGGLRTPSEPLALTWDDVDWERSRITIRSPKTEHHDGGGIRQIPIFPELRPYLDKAWEHAKPGEPHIITRHRPAGGKASWGRLNLRTHLERIVRRAGLEPWPKLWQNLRSTRETELAQSYPIHVVCEWIGHKAAVAAKYYLQVTDADFQRAALCSAENSALAAQNAAQPPAANSSQDDKPRLQETLKARREPGLGAALASVGNYWPSVQAP